MKEGISFTIARGRNRPRQKVNRLLQLAFPEYKKGKKAVRENQEKD